MLQQYMNSEHPDVQDGFRKDRRNRDQIDNICWITEKEREFQKNISFCFIDCAKAFDCVDHHKLWKILKEMGAQVGCMRQALGPGALGRPRGIGWRGRWEGGSGWGTHVNPWLFHFNV